MIAVCLKWVDQRPEFDLLGVPVAPDSRFAGVSAADQAALEWALRCRDAWGTASNEQVLAITVGPPAADAVLRDALAAGADRAIRIDLPFGTPSRVVATCLAEQLNDASMVWCGDYSLDRGTGSVPAFLAHELDAAQALGLIAIDLRSATDTTALRRVDGGRRERLALVGPIVASVEGSTAMLRRASMRSMLREHQVEIIAGPTQHTIETVAAPARPYRPRPRVIPMPAGVSALDRIRSITATDTPVSHGETVTLDPAAAADRIIEALSEWGYRTR